MEEQIQQLWQALQVFLNDSAPLPDRADGALNLFVFFVQWSAVILSALGGLYAAHKRGMDFFGSLVIAFIVPLGGGTLRDLLLGRYPIFWIAEPVYAVTVVVIALLSIFVGREAKRSKTVAKVAQPVEHITDDHSMAYLIITSLALGFWAYLGTIYALEMDTPPVIAPIMGVITASFGAVLRDVFFARVPQSFLSGQLYAIAAAAGAIVYVLLWGAGVNNTVSFLACFVLTFIIRIVSILRNVGSH